MKKDRRITSQNIEYYPLLNAAVNFSKQLDNYSEEQHFIVSQDIFDRLSKQFLDYQIAVGNYYNINKNNYTIMHFPHGNLKVISKTEMDK